MVGVLGLVREARACFKAHKKMVGVLGLEPRTLRV